MKSFRHSSLVTIFSVFLSFSAVAEIPAGYYDSCEGKTGEALLRALNDKIKSHTTISYDGLWDLYKTSDIDENGKIWDMYSTKRWTPGSEQCGNYSAVGSCYNREHSFPKSWFSDKSPMISDGFHIYPTDGKVNGQRSNYPFGECASGTTLPGSGSVKALGRLGSSTFSGYSGTVFEPDDMYKGDFARSYFYMAACYGDVCSSWKGSDMIDKSFYPFFTTWAKNLLMKWTRQDEVSQKELDRQEAVYARQKNRNPFIDHPELAEYIWGDKNGQPWYPGVSAVTPDILTPALGETIDLGVGAINVPISAKVNVKTRAISEGVIVGVYPATFSITPEWIESDDANNGAEITVSYNGNQAGTFYGTLSFAADDLELEVDVKVTIVDGLPIYDASNITSESFTVRWLNIGDAETYSLDVRQGSQSVPGYPVEVAAANQSYTVTGLDPETIYTYQLSSTTILSEIKTVTTTRLYPSIEVLFDGKLHFDAEPGVPSSVAELLLDIENVSDDIVVSVESPFEVSSDKSTWGSSVTLDPEEDRLYLRVNSATEGNFTTSIAITAGEYMTDEAEASATVTDPASIAFVETFDVDDEYAASYSPYKNNTTFTGVAAKWTLSNAGIGNQSQDFAVNGTKVIRFGNTTTSSLTMDEDKEGGLGTVVFEASKWGTDANPTVAVEYSTDGGNSWTLAETVTITTSGDEVTTASATINHAGNGRIRFRQTSGKRWFLDNVSISNYSELQSVDELEYHSWDAYCRDGRLVVECREAAAQVAIYGVDGITWASTRLDAGEHQFNLPKGLYIVVVNDFTRRVLVK